VKPKPTRGRPRQYKHRQNIHIQLDVAVITTMDSDRGDTSRSAYINRILLARHTGEEQCKQ